MELQTKEAYDTSGQEFMQGGIALLQRWLGKHFHEKEALMLTKFFYRCKKDVSQLYRIYESLWTEEKQIFTVDGRLAFTVTPERIWVTDGHEDVEYAVGEWRHIIGRGIAFLEELLPLGSVVELKKEYLEEQMPVLKKAGKVRIVITERYVSYTGNSYFPYAGVPYPTGAFAASRRLMFSPALVDKVLLTGFSDEQEQAYQYLMKQEYLLEKEMDMCGFEPAEERERTRKIMEEEGHGR